jgi:hypothetical protein
MDTGQDVVEVLQSLQAAVLSFQQDLNLAFGRLNERLTTATASVGAILAAGGSAAAQNTAAPEPALPGQPAAPADGHADGAGPAGESEGHQGDNMPLDEPFSSEDMQASQPAPHAAAHETAGAETQQEAALSPAGPPPAQPGPRRARRLHLQPVGTGQSTQDSKALGTAANAAAADGEQQQAPAEQPHRQQQEAPDPVFNSTWQAGTDGFPLKAHESFEVVALPPCRPGGCWHLLNT